MLGLLIWLRYVIRKMLCDLASASLPSSSGDRSSGSIAGFERGLDKISRS